MERDGAQVVTASIAPSSTTPCVVCGAALGLGGWRVVGYPRAAHERCIDWSARAFPYEREIGVLRFLMRRVPELRDVVNALAALRSRWPRDAARVLEEGPRLIHRARPMLSGLDHRDRQKL